MDYEIENQKGAGKFKMENLIWKINNENENGGYWYCSGCGAVYRYPQNWNPPASYCMRCKREWVEKEIKNESE